MEVVVDSGELIEIPRIFYVLLAGEATSRLGNNFFDIAIMIYLYKVTSNSVVIGLVSGLFNVLVLLNLVTGFLADKYLKTRIMQIVDVAQAVLMFIAAAIYFGNDVTVFTIVGISFLSKILGTFFDPAEDALIPQIIDEDHLSQANGLNQGLQMVTQIIGMLLGGILVTLLPITSFVLINGATFLVSLVCLTIVNHVLHEQIVVENDETTLGNWYDGIVYVAHHQVLRSIILLAMIVNLTLGPIMGLDVAWVKGTLHASSFMYSISQVTLMVGIILGNVLVNLVKWSLKRKLLFSLTTMATAVLLMALFQNLIVTLVMMAVIGMAGGFLNVSVFTLIQTRTPGHVLGRVNGAMLAGSNVSLPLGMMLGGLLSGVVSIAVVYIVGAAITLLATLLIVRVDFAEATAE